MIWERLVRMFSNKGKPDPSVRQVVLDSQAKADRTSELLAELQAKSAQSPRLIRARRNYDERLHGTHRSP